MKALVHLEHRGGGCDGAGIMTDIPHRLLEVTEGDAVAHLFLPRDPTRRVRSLRIFEETFRNFGLEVIRYREVPLDKSVLTPGAEATRPEMIMAIVKKPDQCTTRYGFEKMLYSAKQLTRSRLREAGIVKEFFFSSLSAATIVYKALTPSRDLAALFPDLRDPAFTTRFAVFHRRFSTNTATAWDTAQPFRVVAHNGEINTISGNRAWAYARERALGLREDELLTHRGISDSGSVNEMIEALLFRSSIPHPEDILAILMPQADNPHGFYKFWSRAMEPWDGPALFSYGDGRTVGARLDRSGFRPCRWKRTNDLFVLASEAGSFGIPEEEVVAKGSLSGGSSVHISLRTGKVDFSDASRARENLNATFDPRLDVLPYLPPSNSYREHLERLALFGFTEEDVKRVIRPLVQDGKEGIGSMGDSARLAVLSDETRSIFDFFYQRFAQVTNPALDYLRERIVTDMSSVLGRKPNIFEPKELVPLKIGVELPGPILTLGQLEFLRGLDREAGFEGAWPQTLVVDTTFPRAEGIAGLRRRLDEMKATVAEAIKRKVSVFILSDRDASVDHPPIPAILALSALIRDMDDRGSRLRASLVVDSGEIKNTHAAAVLTAYGAAAVCPYLLLELARKHPAEYFAGEATGEIDARELKLVRALEGGLLKVMSKMGISVFGSYLGAELFTILGFSESLHREFFPNQESAVGGLSLEDILARWLRDFSDAPASEERGTSGLAHNYLYAEHPRKRAGERHGMTLQRSKLIHKLVATTGTKLESPELFGQYLAAGTDTDPISFRHLLAPREAATALALDAVEAAPAILARFGSGAMSFGAISAESQRDIFLAMKEIGGRSNSGEGGENPYYFTDGITAHTKQVASGRFGVTASYLLAGKEIQIKIAQGAKPGEGGQLMAVKVSAEIARARHSEPGVDLISPPPMHDIYSIEDLKQLIYELRQLAPETRVSVKLVAGDNIGTIAVGVAKAGADIVHVSGHDGGTGAASLSSMKHAGLPWELGLEEVHRALVDGGIRGRITVRVDGGLFTGRDVVTAAMLGAEEYDFGKLLLIAEGCIMARICEKNTCPTGIATHDPKFKRLYRGSKDRVVRMLTLVAEDVRRRLAGLGVASLEELVGRGDLLQVDPAHQERVNRTHLDLSRFLRPARTPGERGPNPYIEGLSELNARILSDVQSDPKAERRYSIRPYDRAVPATLNGRVSEARLVFRGSAGQGFAVFNTDGIELRLFGEANDSVAKSMSGGKVVVTTVPEAKFAPNENTIVGNCALYGATGGRLYVNGLAGNRFAVRNSGAVAVVEGVGMHACEYMTGGTVIILGPVGLNIGAGMTGGKLYLPGEKVELLNAEYVVHEEMTEADWTLVRALLDDYVAETGSRTPQAVVNRLVKVVPKRKVAPPLTQPDLSRASL